MFLWRVATIEALISNTGKRLECKNTNSGAATSDWNCTTFVHYVCFPLWFLYNFFLSTWKFSHPSLLVSPLLPFLFPCSIVHQRQWCHQAGINGQTKGWPPGQRSEWQLSSVLGRDGLHQWRASQQILQVTLVRSIETQKWIVFISDLDLLTTTVGKSTTNYVLLQFPRLCMNHRAVNILYFIQTTVASQLLLHLVANCAHFGKGVTFLCNSNLSSCQELDNFVVSIIIYS